MGDPITEPKNDATGRQATGAPFRFCRESRPANDAGTAATGPAGIRAPFSSGTRSRLLPTAVAAKVRQAAVDFLTLGHKEKLLLLAVARGLRPTEATDVIAAALEELDAILDLPEDERNAALEEIGIRARDRFEAFDAAVLAQLDPSRRGIFTTCRSGRSTYTPTESRKARSTSCILEKTKQDKKTDGRKAKRGRPAKTGAKKAPAQPRAFSGIISFKVTGCHNCRKGPGEWCVSCKRCNRDDIRIQKQPHNVRMDLTTEKPEPGTDAEPATPLAPAVEDLLRRLLATFADLRPLETLSMVHTLTRSGETFADFLRHFAATMRDFENDESGRRFGRATFTYSWNQIAKTRPAFSVFKTWTGHSGQRADKAAVEELEAEPETTAEEIDGEPIDHSRDRQQPIDADRDEAATDYFFDDGSGTEL